MRTFSLLTALAMSTPAFATDVVYVSVAGEKRIAIFQLDPDSGRLKPAGEIDTGG
jgi:hypothetical protein